jgi:multidrug efflux pump subunit AcrB
MNIPLRSVKNSVLKLGDVATIKKTYANSTMSKIALYQQSGFNSVELTFYKKVGTNVFTVAQQTRANIQKLLSQPSYANLSVAYTFDLADNISQDYDDLVANGWQTILLVFLVAWIFIGFRESLITTLSFPLALFVTFFYLNSQ